MKKWLLKQKTYFENKDKSLNENGIKKLEEYWAKCIILKGDYLDEYSWILPEKHCFIS